MPIMERQRTTEIEQLVSIEVGAGVQLRGELAVPEECFGLALCTHSSEMGGSIADSRLTALELERQGLAVLAFDLLSLDEEDKELGTGVRPIDIPAMASRFLRAAAWANQQPDLRGLPIGFVGAGAAAPAALIAAAQRPALLGGIVCQNGRVDLAGFALAKVQAPALLIVGASDASLVRSNESTLMRLGSARKELLMIPAGSSRQEHLREQEIAADLTAEWLSQTLILAGN